MPENANTARRKTEGIAIGLKSLGHPLFNHKPRDSVVMRTSAAIF